MSSFKFFTADIFEKCFGISYRSQTEVISSQTKIYGSLTGEETVTDFWRRPISVKEVVISSVILVLFCAAPVALFSHYPYYPCCFHQLSAAIRHGDFSGLDPSQPKELWGYSYVSALVATITRLPDDFAMVIVSSSMFVVANYLCCRLWGTTVAAWFMVVNYWWLDGAAEGFTEPLFMALLLSSFIAFRKERWVVAAVLASAATIVRPNGIFALIAIGIVLLSRRELRKLAIATAIGLTTGVLYTVPLILIYGNPLVNVTGYQGYWSGGMPVTIPFLAIIKGAKTVTSWSIWSRLYALYSGLIAAWVLFAVAGTIKMAASKRFWHYAKTYPAEAIFAGASALFLFSYADPLWAWFHFPRYATPLLPFLLVFSFERLTRDRRILGGVALLNISASVLPHILDRF
jgi:hypothetical protein